jgi:hypothetical protein
VLSATWDATHLNACPSPSQAPIVLFIEGSYSDLEFAAFARRAPLARGTSNCDEDDQKDGAS